MAKQRSFGRILSLVLVLSFLLGMMSIYPISAENSSVDEYDTVEEEKLPIYKDKSYSFEERAADLVSRLTLNEKASQMNSGWSPAISRDDVQVGWYGWWNEALHGVSRLQRMQVGNATTIYNTTSYPISLSMGSTWDPELMYRVATEIGDESREVTEGNNKSLTYWSPTVNLNRDPRWGRADESFGEDPYLTASIASQFVNGMEGKDMEGNRLDENGYLKTVSTIKHYLGNNSENNRLNGSTNITERELREYYSYVYRLIVEQSDVSSVMSSYNRINEVPANLNDYTLDTLLRQTFGFSGYVTSDCDSVWIAYTGSGYDRDPLATSGNGNGHGWRLPGTGVKISNLETIAWAINAGGDLDCNAGYSGRSSGFDYAQLVPTAAKANITTPSGLFDENSVDISLQRLYKARMELGEFDDQDGVVSWYNDARDRIETNYGEDWVYASSATNGATTVTNDRLDLVEEAGNKSLILLKNEPVDDGDPLLPLDVPSTGPYKVAVIGHFAQPSTTNNSMFLGGYSCNMGTSGYDKMVNPYNGIKEAIQAINPDAEVTFTKGFTSGTTAATLTTIDTAAVTAAANNADVCIVFVGTDSGSANEQSDRVAGLTLPGAQAELIKMVGDLNPNTVAVMETISPNDTNVFEDSVPAMLWSCYNGMLKGKSLSNVLLGYYNPSARTSELWYDSVNQLNNTKSYRLTPGEDVQPYAPNTTFSGAQTSDTYTYGNSNGRTYMYYDESLGGAVQYPFGYGLSYTTFDYSNLTVDGINNNVADANAKLTVSVDVENTGDYDGTEIVQLYVATPGSPAALEMPIKRLVGYANLEVKAGETETATIEVDVEDFAYYDEDAGKYVVYNGAYQLQVSKNSKEVVLSKDFTVTGTLLPKVSVVTVKANQEGDTEKDIPERLIYQPNKEVNAQVTISMSDDTLYGYVMKGSSTTIPSNFKISYSSNRPEVVTVEDGVIMTAHEGVATITTTVTDTLSGTTGTYDTVVVVSNANAAYMDSITVDGEVIEGFDPYVFNYEIVVPEDANVADYVVSGTPGNAAWTAEYTQVESFPGSAAVRVTNESGYSTYTIKFKYPEVLIESAVAENGKLTLNMSFIPAAGLQAGDFSAEIALDAFEQTELTLSNMQVNTATSTVTFSYPQVAKTLDTQQVSISVRYLDKPAVNTSFMLGAYVTGLQVTGAATTLKKGATMQLAGVALPLNADNPNIIWTSSNESIATVVNGLITGIKAGSVTITATTAEGGFTQRFVIKIM